MATTQELFGGDGSSSEDDEVKEATKGMIESDDEVFAKKEEEAPKNDESSKDDATEKATPPAETTTTVVTKKKPSIMDDDSDDDDENEPEFDDDGAVVGLTSPTMAGSKTNRPSNAAPIRPRREDDDILNDNDDSSVEEAEDEGDIRTLVVQESNRPKDVPLHIAKMPNLVGIQTIPFDEGEYSKRQEDEDFGKAAFNLIRWRYKANASGEPVRGEDGEFIRESNTRIVEWEDGSYTMHVGDEVFAIDMIDSTQSNGFPGLNGYLFMSSQAASYKEDDTPAGTVLECMGSIASRVVIKPTSLQSDAHKILTHGIRQKTIKASRISEIATQHDPEKEKQARLKMKSDLDKVNVRKRPAGGSRPRMSRSYLNEEEFDDGDEDTYNLKAMKRRAMGGGYDDDESEEEDFEDSFRQARKKKKEESSDDEEMQIDDEDEDAPIMASKKKKQAGVFDDDDSD